MAEYLVTGVAGFIGGSLASRLIKEGHSVTGIDNFSSGFKKNIPDEVKFIEGHCHEAELYAELEDKKFDAIFHIAGQNSDVISFDNPVYDLKANTLSTLMLLGLAKKIECPRFIYASSMSVYGNQENNEAAVEESPCKPLSFFGTAKLASENYIRLYENFGIDTTILRLFNVYGPGQNMENERRGMVSIFMAMAENDGHLAIKGSPNRFRDFVYIDDVVEAFMLCLSRPQSKGQIINIGTGIRTSVAALIRKLRHMSSQPTTLEYVGSTAGDMDGIFADISNAAKYLAFEPAVYLDDGLKRMHSWYLEQLK